VPSEGDDPRSIDVCPHCGSSAIEHVATFGETTADFYAASQVTMSSWQVARCSGCGAYLRRTADAISGSSRWQVEADTTP